MRRNRLADRGSLLRHRNYRLLLAGAAVSQTGSQVTIVAVPLLAALELQASPMELAVLTATESLGLLCVGLPAGAWVDRMRRRPVMIAADLVRFLAIASVPLAATLGVLTITQLYVVVWLTGMATVLFDVADQSFLPRLLPPDRLVAGNGNLAVVQSSAEVAGPGLGGTLVQVVGAPLAVLIDGFSYLMSAALLARIHVEEQAPGTSPGSTLRRDIVLGITFVLGHRLLRAITFSTAVTNFFTAMLLAVQVTFWVHVLELSAFAVGWVSAASAVGGLVAAVLAGRLADRVGHSRMIWVSLMATSPFALLWPLSSGPWSAAIFAVGSFGIWFGAVIYNVGQLSFRQVLCPPEMLGRMNATIRFICWGTMPIGALLGGAVVTASGDARLALWVCAAGFLAAPIPVLLPPLRHVRDLPRPDEVPEVTEEQPVR
ncbi:MFS transporter [Actinacidiphila glaucinigra]|uniref:MFS transporter n=1 Tax=Actinacidiphila glaucinigra TaxID=235986 RepID=UPI003D8EA071